MTVRASGENTPSDPESSGDEEEEEDKDEDEGEITPSPHSPPLEDLPLLDYHFSQQVGISVGAHRVKHPRTRAGG
jgi:hypothetical protein